MIWPTNMQTKLQTSRRKITNSSTWSKQKSHYPEHFTFCLIQTKPKGFKGQQRDGERTSSTLETKYKHTAAKRHVHWPYFGPICWPVPAGQWTAAIVGRTARWPRSLQTGCPWASRQSASCAPSLGRSSCPRGSGGRCGGHCTCLTALSTQLSFPAGTLPTHQQRRQCICLYSLLFHVKVDV